MDFDKHMDPMYCYRALVTSVYDGDTCTCDIDLGFGLNIRKQKIRLYGINAPEVRGDSKESGKITRDYLREKIQDKWINLYTISDKKGKYGRWLGILSLDGTNLNKELVEKNLAKYQEY